MKIFLTILVVAIIATAILYGIELMIGAPALFIIAAIIVAWAAVIVLFIQFRNKSKFLKNL